ncbi:hypothetical protein [Amycolatopsis orientalis]|uniref:hypothetical protein n=1 Tax=Amycolatopsis orientalis TaxID=31958 RepID=UPI0004091C85|nr:hypothetical protein [Amycolatopsis orientalis]
MKAEERWPTTGQAPQTLVWQGNGLVDWASGYSWYPDGRPGTGAPLQGYGDIYNGVAVSPSGRYQVVYAEYGLDAILLDQGEVLRALTRDDDDPDAFFYPVTFGRLTDGREVLVHCPEHRDRLEIELPATGERLTTRALEPDVHLNDIYHSRLEVSPGGRWLLSAGWVWHPFGVAQVFDLDAALTDPGTLDAIQPCPEQVGDEVESACWLDEDRLAVFSMSTVTGSWPQLSSGELGVWSMEAAGWASKASYGEHVGTMTRFGDHLLSFYEYPKLLEPATGAVVEAWPHLPTGKRMVAYGLQYEPLTVAVHPDGTRFAVASDEFITVVDWSE